MTGVYVCAPRDAPFHYRETLHLGTAPFAYDECKRRLLAMKITWQGTDYDLLNHNCNDFANTAATELLGFGIPKWINAAARRFGKSEEARRLSRIPNRDPEKHYSKLYPELASPDKAGYLTKQGQGGYVHKDNWQRRWFVLKGHFLWYLEDEYDGAICGCIPLEGVTLRHCDQGTDSFEVCHKSHRSFYLSAYNSTDRSSWVGAIYEKNEEIDSFDKADLSAMRYLLQNRKELVDNPWAYGMPHLMGADRTGVLVKQGSGFPYRWQERHFVLKGCGLWYFKDGSPEPQGVIIMNKHTAVALPDGEKGSENRGEFAFEIQRSEGTCRMLLRSSTLQSQQDWVRALCSASSQPLGNEAHDAQLLHWNSKLGNAT